jgi:ubiquinol-cytochrome c reductase iron-sulfur subunit
MTDQLPDTTADTGRGAAPEAGDGLTQTSGHEEERTPARVDDVMANPGLPAHQWRPTDVDPKAERRAERQVAALFLLSFLGAVLFIVSYFAFSIGDSPDTIGNLGASNVALGVCLAVTLLALGGGVIQWARKLMADHEIVEMRHRVSSPPEDREATVAILKTGLEESGLGRRPLIRNSLLAAGGILGILPVIMLRDLGPLPGKKLDHTVWDINSWDAAEKAWWETQDRTLQRVVRDVVGTPIKATDLEIGDLVNSLPEVLFATDEDNQPVVEGTQLLVDKAKAAVILHRMIPSEIVSAQTLNWSVDGIVCYSKICTHVGCPISLNERTTHNLLCPCHQSTFDLADSGRVLFGPAARSLPQLQITVDDEGYLAAVRDFTEPVGPSFWERG